MHHEVLLAFSFKIWGGFGEGNEEKCNIAN